MPLTDASSLARAVDEQRSATYALGDATLALTSPLPLAAAAQLLCAAFAPTVDPSDTNPGPTQALAVGARPGVRPPVRPPRQAAALPFAGREEARAVEIGRRG